MRFLMFLLLALTVATASKSPDEGKDDWKKKDIRDYSEEDMNRLLAQWDEDEEPIPLDELPEGHPDRPRAQVRTGQGTLAV